MFNKNDKFDIVVAVMLSLSVMYFTVAMYLCYIFFK